MNEELIGTISPIEDLQEEDSEITSVPKILKLLTKLTALTLIGLSFFLEDFGPLFTLLLLFVIVVPLEKIFPRHKGQPVRRKNWRLDVNYALAAPAMAAIGGAFTIAIGILSLAWIPGLCLTQLWISTCNCIQRRCYGLAC